MLSGHTRDHFQVFLLNNLDFLFLIGAMIFLLSGRLIEPVIGIVVKEFRLLSLN
jgi:hypothetical protein